MGHEQPEREPQDVERPPRAYLAYVGTLYGLLALGLVVMLIAVIVAIVVVAVG
jgi:hypothetical protein